MDDSFVTMSDLQYRIVSLKRELEAFKTGDKYISLKNEYHAMLAHEEKIIRGLEQELSSAHQQIKKVRNSWYATCEMVAEENRKTITKQAKRIETLESELANQKEKNISDRTNLRREYSEKLKEKDAIIDELENKLAHYKALLDIDGTNSGIPTSQTPIGKKKIIPNTREKSGKLKGGQPGHKRHELTPPSDEDVTNVVEHEIEEDDVCCRCGCYDLEYTGEHDDKYVYDVEIKTIKTKHIYYTYRCKCCGQLIRVPLEPGTKNICQYGPTLQAMALSLANTVNSPMNKTAGFISGITLNELNPCQGYIASLQGKGANGLKEFMKDLYKKLISSSLLYWDDTVIMINTNRGCLRFYGNESIAYYTAHNNKDMLSLDEDKILEMLTEETKVMHDHNTVNYNGKYHFMNLECNQHLQRDLKKSADETGHNEFIELKDLISQMIHERNELIKHSENSFPQKKIDDFYYQLDDILDRADKKNVEADNKYSGPFERRIINRLRKYKECYFEWLKDFTLPTTNNLSERALRCVKSHMKISGQFESQTTASYYATIKSYIETCRRNGINEVEALQRLCAGHPYTVDEILQESPN